MCRYVKKSLLMKKLQERMRMRGVKGRVGDEEKSEWQRTEEEWRAGGMESTWTQKKENEQRLAGLHRLETNSRKWLYLNTNTWPHIHTHTTQCFRLYTNKSTSAISAMCAMLCVSLSLTPIRNLIVLTHWGHATSICTAKLQKSHSDMNVV